LRSTTYAILNDAASPGNIAPTLTGIVNMGMDTGLDFAFTTATTVLGVIAPGGSAGAFVSYTVPCHCQLLFFVPAVAGNNIVSAVMAYYD
jgi:hypothetical protein